LAVVTFYASLTVCPGVIAVPPARIIAELGITTAAIAAPPATAPSRIGDPSSAWTVGYVHWHSVRLADLLPEFCIDDTTTTGQCPLLEEGITP
jgi:hypothetical protein